MAESDLLALLETSEVFREACAANVAGLLAGDVFTALESAVSIEPALDIS
jgi:hypothetical protein